MRGDLKSEPEGGSVPHGARKEIPSMKMGHMVAVQNGAITDVPLEVAAGGPRIVPFDHPLIAAARSIGTSFGA